MELTITLEGESGTTYESFNDLGLLQAMLPDHNENNSYCLRYVDVHGDTTFNTLQMPDLIDELQQLLEKTDKEEEKNILNEVIRISIRCKDDVHLYVKFYGD